jgi:alkanesulfonate monooxygenase SsuD/methylene tetrahydromethanopterin reductase-like flavin-dependent oxidoreductase (luciferase family)
VRDVTLPAIERGLARAGRRREDFSITCPVFVVTGSDGAAFAASRDAVCKQIAFYGSTPAYRAVLESSGFGALQPELNRLSKAGQWDEMGRLVDSDVLEAFAVVGEPQEIAAKIERRYGGIVDRILGGVLPGDPEESLRLRELHAIGDRAQRGGAERSSDGGSIGSG